VFVRRTRQRTKLQSSGIAVVVAVLAIACAAPVEEPPEQAAPAVPTQVAVPTSPPPTSAPPASTQPTVQTAAPTVQAAAPQPPPTAGPSPTAAVRAPDRATELVLLAVQFESALNRGDVEAALALFEDEAEVKIPPDVYVGAAQIRGWLEYLAANHFAAEPGFRNSAADRVTWPLAVRSDYLNRLGLPSLDGAATLVGREGKIASYTFVLSRESAARHRAAQLKASQVLQDPVIVGLTGNIYGFNDVFRDSTGKLISYRDVLTSEPGSGPFFDLGGEPIIVRSGF
jgi:hypothetical protein